MTENVEKQNNVESQDQQESSPKNSEPKIASESPQSSGKSLLFLLAALIGLTWFVIRDPERAKNICLMLFGFGAVIFVHELGHFIAAKSVGIEVDAFSLGINPIIFGIKRIRDGFRVRILPGLIPGKDGQGALSFTIRKPGAAAGETEYRLCLIPFGGFVKMLGQEDLAADQPSDNPRAFGNKKIWQRVLVISAGVFMNIVMASIIFLIVFSKGLSQPPAIVGDVAPDSPAAKAGLRPGSEILEINGKENVTFMDIKLAAAFADKGEKVEIKARHPDDGKNAPVQTFYIEPVQDEEQGVMVLGIAPPADLTLTKFSDEKLQKDLERIGFNPGDKIIAVNQNVISRADQLQKYLYPKAGIDYLEHITLTVERTNPDGQTIPKDIVLPMTLALDSKGKQPGQVLTMVPLPRIHNVLDDSPAQSAGIKKDDIILSFGTLQNPTLKEMQDYISSRADEGISTTAYRYEQNQYVKKQLTVTPKHPPRTLWQWLTFKKPPPMIGISYSPTGVQIPIVANTVALKDSMKPLKIPRGATITAVAEQPVQDWQDIIKQLMKFRGKEVSITYITPHTQITEILSTPVPDNLDWIGLAYHPDLDLIPFLPLKNLETIVRGSNPWQSLCLGADMTYSMIAQTYLMFRGMIVGRVKVKAARGPVGILRMSYVIAQEKSLLFYCFFIGMINVAIAVFNFLPLPILDGGHVVLLLVEKIKGSPVSLKVQSVITYAGLVLIGGLFLWVTFYDIMRIFTGEL